MTELVPMDTTADGFTRLQWKHLKSLKNRILKRLDRVFRDRGGYHSGQRKALEQIVEAVLDIKIGTATAVTLTPGGGKSTTLRAIVIELCEEFFDSTFLSTIIGGGIVVVETIAEALEFAETCYKAGIPPEIIRVIQTPNQANLKNGGCIAEIATVHEECPGADCPRFGECPIYASLKMVDQVPFIIITRERYLFFMESLGPLESWSTEDGTAMKRNILLIDEAPEMIDENVLQSVSLAQLSAALGNTKQFRLNPILERWWNRAVIKPFLAAKELISKSPDTFGSLTREQFEEFGFDFESLERLLSRIVTSSRNRSTTRKFRSLLTGIIQGEHKYFLKNRDISIMVPRLKQITGENMPATFIFSGTADLIPELAQNPEIQMLDTPLDVDFSRLTFHIQRGNEFNFTKTASFHDYNLEGAIEWAQSCISGTLSQHDKVFVMTYRDHAPEVWEALKGEFGNRLVPYQERDGSDPYRVPYFGGTNGSNNYLSCTGVIALGFNRFPPDSYLSRAVAMAGVSEEWKKLLDGIQSEEQLIDRMQSTLLAQELIQLIFRSDLRNHGSTRHIDVCLLHPPVAVLKLLARTFPGCKFLEYDRLTNECLIASLQRTYKGKRRHHEVILEQLLLWDGSEPITRKAIAASVPLTPEQFKEGWKHDAVKAFLAERTTSTGTTKDKLFHLKPEFTHDPEGKEVFY